MIHGRPLRLAACASLLLLPADAFTAPRPLSAPSTAARRPSRLLASGGADPSPDPTIEAGTWTFRGVHPVHYEVASCGDAASGDAGAEVVPLVLLAGFGVASFHYRRLMRELLERHREADDGRDDGSKRRELRVYAFDYLGQGRSWPPGCDDGTSPSESGLGYSADTWLDQAEGFVSEVVLAECGGPDGEAGGGGKVHLLGNSVGGYLSTMLAHRRPDLVGSLTLVNATPVWGLNLPGWDGRLPAPTVPRLLGRAGFDLIRDPDIISRYLDGAYVHRPAHDGSHPDSFHPPGASGHDPYDSGRPLSERIRECTEGPGGHAAFASILFSPPASDPGTGRAADFYPVLGGLGADVLLLFGEEDPWCVPPVARRMHVALSGRGDGGGEDAPASRYVSVGGCGHCPVHEAPRSVAGVVVPWLVGRGGRDAADLVGSGGSGGDGLAASIEVDEPWGTMTVREVGVGESRGQGPADKLLSYLVG